VQRRGFIANRNARGGGANVHNLIALGSRALSVNTEMFVDNGADLIMSKTSGELIRPSLLIHF
jgi:hypothetical protein